MHYKFLRSLISFVFLLAFVSLACTTGQPVLTPTNTTEPTATQTASPTATQTLRPSPTPRPTHTPNLAATEQAEKLGAEIEEYFAKGYLSTTEGTSIALEDFSYDWAQLGWYLPFLVQDSAGDFVLGAHFKWDSAFKNSDISGCGFIFGIQPNDDHYAVFLDRQKVFFLITDRTRGFSKPVSPTRGTGIVKFDYPAEADFTLIVKGAYAYVLVNGENVAEYTLAESRSPIGGVGLTVLSGTNKGYGTHCEMTDLRLWLPRE
jgi:hypothetical protein